MKITRRISMTRRKRGPARPSMPPSNLLTTRWPLRYSTSLQNFREKRLIMPKRTGLTMRRNFYSGPSRNIAEVKESLLKSSTRMTGSRSLASSRAVTTRSASTSSTKIRNLPSRRVIGWSVKMRSWSNWFARTVPNSGVRLRNSLTRILVPPEMVNNVEKDGSTSWTQRSRRTHSASPKTSLFSRSASRSATSGPRSRAVCRAEPRTPWRIGSIHW